MSYRYGLTLTKALDGIVPLAAKGKTAGEIAAKVGCTPQQVNKLARRYGMKLTGTRGRAQ